jgi:exodeoxyribonuclease VII large subunit
VTDRILPVGVVLKRIKQVLESDALLSDAWVEGEVSKFQVWNSGHAYFTLKDDSGVLDGTMWKAKLKRQSFIPRVGDQVIVNGTVTVYEARGQLQFDAEVFQPAGVGLLQAQLEALRQTLEAEGLFEPARKRELPTFPTKIGVVTSPSGAVWHDIQRVVERRYPLVELILAPAVVQGDQAPKAIVNAIERLQAIPDLDLMIVGRGGGSIEDLWCFNDERVVRAIFASRVPVISAVGHETDFTLSDFVADMRAPTPSAAAELAVPDADVLLQGIEGMRLTARAFVLASLQERLAEVHALAHRLQYVSPLHQLTTQDSVLANLWARASFAIERIMHREDTRIERIRSVLEVLDPHAMLRRGYVQITRASDGSLISRVSQARPGERIRATFDDGFAEMTTTSIMTSNTPDARQAAETGTGRGDS